MKSYDYREFQQVKEELRSVESLLIVSERANVALRDRIAELESHLEARLHRDGDWCEICKAPQWVLPNGEHDCLTHGELRGRIIELETTCSNLEVNLQSVEGALREVLLQNYPMREDNEKRCRSCSRVDNHTPWCPIPQVEVALKSAFARCTAIGKGHLTGAYRGECPACLTGAKGKNNEITETSSQTNTDS